jgi:uncharacterized membrane protein YozB (DUF420 family)
MEELLKQPGFLGTHATLGADLSQLMATLFTGLFIIGWIQAKQGRGHAHHWLMLGGMVAMLSFFVSYYWFRQLGALAFAGKEGFGGSQEMYDNFFWPLLKFHIVLVIIGLIMAVYMIVLGFRAQAMDGMKRILDNRILQTTWKKMGMIFGALASLVLVYFGVLLMSGGFSLGKVIVWVSFLLILAVVLGLELSIQRMWPSGERRHRALGLFTMIIYCILFVTGTTTYTMLYILYPGKIG